MTIPRKIHYCWFGGAPMGKHLERCMNTWQRFCPDYEFVRWDESNAPLRDNGYVSEAYQERKWAFVSDYVRLKALCSQGGVYLDTDVELLKPLDAFLSCEAFMGFESAGKIGTALMACRPEHPFFMEAVKQYEKKHFLHADGSVDDTPNVKLFTDMLVAAGLKRNDTLQTVGGVTIYPAEFFSPKSLETGKLTLTDRSHAIHYFKASWVPMNKRVHTRLAQFLGPQLTRCIKRLMRRA